MQYARTEQIQNNQNPQFIKSVEITYQFEVVQRLRFSVYDIDNDSASLADDDYLGGMECTLAEVKREGREGQTDGRGHGIGWVCNMSLCSFLCRL